MSVIKTILKKVREIEYLLEIDFQGIIKRFAQKTISVFDENWSRTTSLGAEISSGPLTEGTLYKITAEGEADTFPTDKAQQSVYFDGTDGYAYAADNDGLDITGACYIALWATLAIDTDTSLSVVLLSKGGVGGGTPFCNYALWYYQTSKIMLFEYAYEASRKVHTDVFPVPTDGEEHCYIITWDGTTDANGIKLYYDGDYYGQLTASGIWVANDRPVGIMGATRTSSPPQAPAEGAVRKVVIGNRFLTADEVADLYESGIAEVDQWGSQTPIYETDFSSDSGWTLQYGATISGGVLTFPADTARAYRSAMAAVKSGQVHAVEYEVISNDLVGGAGLYFIGDNVNKITPSNVVLPQTVGFHTVELPGQTAGNLNVYPFFQLLGTVTSGSLVIDNVKIYKRGAVLALEPEGIRLDKWWDSSDNNNDGVYSGGITPDVDLYFTSDGTESCDSDNKVQPVIVTSADTEARLFTAAILNQISFGSRLDLNSMTYSVQNVTVSIANKDRLQDEEIRRRLDSGTATIYIWATGLAWSDISSDGVLLKGTFQKQQYDKFQFNFSIVGQAHTKFMDVPHQTISTDTWPNHRKSGTGGSVAGLPQQIVFGDWARGVPVLYVDTSGYKFLAMAGVSLSTDTDYSGGVKNLYDIDNGIIDPLVLPYTFYPSKTDGKGNPCAYFDFIANPVNSEPKHCGIKGLIDNAGIITGTAGTLIEHPADIVYYMLEQFTTLDSSEIDVESLKTMRTLLPGLKFAVIINDTVNILDVIDRILYQCQYARIQRKGKMGVVGLHTDAPDLSTAKTFDQIGRTVKVTSTPDTAVVNDLLVKYNLNPFTKRYESEFVKDRSNSEMCKKSYYQYGQRAQKILTLVDVQHQATAEVLANRYIELNAFRHEIVERETPISEGFDVMEGDCELITCEEGTSADGTGWIDEPCILLDRTFNGPVLTQRWWKIAV